MIPDELQEHVVPWIKGKLHEVENVSHRQHYRRLLTRAALKEPEGRDIWWRSHLGNSISALYHRDGEWRVGHRGAAASLLRRIEDDFLHQLRQFAQQRPEWVKISELPDPA